MLNSMYFNFVFQFYSSGFIFFKAFPGLPLLVLGAGFLALGLAIFLPPALFDLGAGFLEPSAVFLADIFLPADAPFTAFHATLPKLCFSGAFFGAFDVTLPKPCFCWAFSFLAAALAASAMRLFSSEDTLKQPAPFLPGCAPATSTPSSRIFFSTLLRMPAFLATSTLYLLPRWFLMAPREDPDLSFWVMIASITMSLYFGLPEELPFSLTLVFFVALAAGASTTAGASTVGASTPAGASADCSTDDMLTCILCPPCEIPM